MKCDKLGVRTDVSFVREGVLKCDACGEHLDARTLEPLQPELPLDVALRDRLTMIEEELAPLLDNSHPLIIEDDVPAPRPMPPATKAFEWGNPRPDEIIGHWRPADRPNRATRRAAKKRRP